MLRPIFKLEVEIKVGYFFSSKIIRDVIYSNYGVSLDSTSIT